MQNTRSRTRSRVTLILRYANECCGAQQNLFNERYVLVYHVGGGR